MTPPMWKRVHWAAADPGTAFTRDELPALEKPEGGGVYGTNTVINCRLTVWHCRR